METKIRSVFETKIRSVFETKIRSVFLSSQTFFVSKSLTKKDSLFLF